MNQTNEPRRPLQQSFSGSEFLHLSALNSFAFLQPILDRLGDNARFLRLMNYSGAAVLSSMAIMLTVIPIAVSVVTTLLRWRGRPAAARNVLAGAVGALSILFFLLPVRWCSATFDLLARGIPDSAGAVLAAVAGGCAAVLYFRSSLYRQVIALSAAGVLLFPVSFLNTTAIREQVLGIASRQYHTEVQAQHPVPVLMIVFDGLCGMALLNEQHDVDGIRYPNFARLGTISNFYRNASTVHPRTDHALPAALCSCVPMELQLPVEADYPTNLFRLIHNTNQFDMTVFEPVTQLAPGELRRVTKRRPLLSQTAELTETLVRVWLKTSIPQELRADDSLIPLEWFGILPPRVIQERAVDGLVNYGWDTMRKDQCEHFAECLTPRNKPGFRFLHVVVPHDPWNLLPSGNSYLPRESRIAPLFGTNYNVGDDTWTSDEWIVRQAWQRYLLQLQFADRWLGRFLDRLEETGQLQEALIVVTADHGMAFAAGQSRRTPTDATLPDIVSIPLFIKQPRQQTPEVSDRNVETIDILPTMADILGLPKCAEWEGTSLLTDVPERPRKTFTGPATVLLNPEFPQRYQYVERMIHALGSGSQNDQLGHLHYIPALAGVAVSDIARGENSIWTCELSRGGSVLSPDRPHYVPCYYRGTLVGAPENPQPVLLAVALNGVVQATTRTSTDPVLRHEWAALVSESSLRTQSNTLQLFEVEQDGDRFILHEISLKAISP